MVGEPRNQEFIAKTLRMVSASEEDEQPPNFSFRTDDNFASQNKGHREQSVKLRAILIHTRINGIEHSYLQDRSFWQSVQSVSARWM